MANENYFGEGEQVDITVKQNETGDISWLLEEVDAEATEASEDGEIVWKPINLTGATYSGGLKKKYSDPEYVKQFTFSSPQPATGSLTATWLLGHAGGFSTREMVWDAVVTLSNGRKIRAGAGVAYISFGVGK